MGRFEALAFLILTKCHGYLFVIWEKSEVRCEHTSRCVWCGGAVQHRDTWSDSSWIAIATSLAYRLHVSGAKPRDHEQVKI